MASPDPTADRNQILFLTKEGDLNIQEAGAPCAPRTEHHTMKSDPETPTHWNAAPERKVLTLRLAMRKDGCPPRALAPAELVAGSASTYVGRGASSRCGVGGLVMLGALALMALSGVSCERSDAERIGRGMREVTDAFRGGWETPRHLR
jgi:hypothetical protein